MEQKMSNELRIESVDWIDSNSKFGWLDKVDCKCDIIVCQSVGYVIDETDEGIALAQSRLLSDSDGYKPYADIISIPKVAIKHRVAINRY